MHRVCLFALATALVVTPALADAQRRPAPRTTTRVVRADDDDWRRRDDVSSRTMTLSVGVFNYDFADDDNYPMAALRADWRLRNWLRSELSFAYAYADIDDPALPEEDEDNSHLLAATVGLNAELPWPVVRPYAGLAVGLFSRLDDGEDGDFVRPTVAAPVGVRIPFSSRIALRGEVRWRFDQHPDGDSAVNREITAGLSFGY